MKASDNRYGYKQTEEDRGYKVPVLSELDSDFSYEQYNRKKGLLEKERNMDLYVDQSMDSFCNQGFDDLIQDQNKVKVYQNEDDSSEESVGLNNTEIEEDSKFQD